MSEQQISIRTHRSHWRAGVYFEQGKPRIFAEDAFTDEQLELLEADPELLIEELEGEAEGSDEPLLRPEDEAEVRLSIQTAMLASLTKKDFTKDGRPRVDAIEKALGWKATSDEIAAALEALSEEQKAQLSAVMES